MVQNKENCNKELKFMNYSEPIFVLKFLSKTFILLDITLKVFLNCLEHFTSIQEPVGSTHVRIMF